MIIDGEEKPISYASRTYNKQEMNWCITRREMLSMIFALKQFRQYCLGRKILVCTNHAPLVSIQSTPTPSSQICRWLDFLAEYEMNILHRPGILHGNADRCSRVNVACKQCKLSAESYAQLDAKISTFIQREQKILQLDSNSLNDGNVQRNSQGQQGEQWNPREQRNSQ